MQIKCARQQMLIEQEKENLSDTDIQNLSILFGDGNYGGIDVGCAESQQKQRIMLFH